MHYHNTSFGRRARPPCEISSPPLIRVIQPRRRDDRRASYYIRSSLHNNHFFLLFFFWALSTRRPVRFFSGGKEKKKTHHKREKGKKKAVVDIAVSLIKPIITAIMTLLTRARAHGCRKNALTVYRGEKPLRAVCDKKKRSAYANRRRNDSLGYGD